MQIRIETVKNNQEPITNNNKTIKQHDKTFIMDLKIPIKRKLKTTKQTIQK